MIKNNVALLDMDEHERELRERCTPADILAFCRKYDLICDLATSDVVIYIKDSQNNSICLG